MNETAQQVAAMMSRLRAIYEHTVPRDLAASEQRWLVDAVELLLRIELERQA